MSDIFVISDLHIGDGGPRDNFGYEGSKRPEALRAFLDHVEEENGSLIIVGDLLEFWQTNLSSVIVHNLELLERIGKLCKHYVIGNHDADLYEFIGTDILRGEIFKKMTTPEILDIGGRKFKFMHGHEVDAFNSGLSPSWGRMLAIFAGIFEEKNGSPVLTDGKSVESVLEGVGTTALTLWNGWVKWRKLKKQGKGISPKQELTPAQNSSRADEMLKKYEAHRNEAGCDVLIVGHTHEPGRIGDWYYNTGSWATTGNNFVRITPDGEVAIFDWTDTGPVENTKQLAETAS